MFRTTVTHIINYILMGLGVPGYCWCDLPLRCRSTGFQDSIPNIVVLVKLGEEPVKTGMPVERVTRRIRQEGGECRMLFMGTCLCVFGVSSGWYCSSNRLFSSLKVEVPTVIPPKFLFAL